MCMLEENTSSLIQQAEGGETVATPYAHVRPLARLKMYSQQIYTHSTHINQWWMQAET